MDSEIPAPDEINADYQIHSLHIAASTHDATMRMRSSSASILHPPSHNASPSSPSSSISPSHSPMTSALTSHPHYGMQQPYNTTVPFASASIHHTHYPSQTLRVTHPNHQYTQFNQQSYAPQYQNHQHQSLHPYNQRQHPHAQYASQNTQHILSPPQFGSNTTALISIPHSGGILPSPSPLLYTFSQYNLSSSSASSISSTASSLNPSATHSQSPAAPSVVVNQPQIVGNMLSSLAKKHQKPRAETHPRRKEEQDELSVRDEAGSTPLHWAIIHGQIEKSIQLISKGANVHAKNNSGYTPLHCAAEFGNTRLVSLLIDHGADPEETNHYGHTSLHCASRWGHKSVMVLLIKQYECDVNTQDKNGWSPLHFAAFHGFDVLVRLLCDNGADFSLLTKKGENPLHGASVNGHEKCADILIRTGSPLDAADSRGRTPLHYAAFNGHEKTVRLLVSHGADLWVKDAFGRTPLETASKSCAVILQEVERNGPVVLQKQKTISDEAMLLVQCHFDGIARKTKISYNSNFQTFFAAVNGLFESNIPLRILYMEEDHQGGSLLSGGLKSEYHTSFHLISVINENDYALLIADLHKKRSHKLRIFLEPDHGFHTFFLQSVVTETEKTVSLRDISAHLLQPLDLRLIRVPLNYSLHDLKHMLLDRYNLFVESLYCKTGEYLLSVETEDDWNDIVAELSLVARYHNMYQPDHSLFPSESASQVHPNSEKFTIIRGPHPNLVVISAAKGNSIRD